MRLTASTLFRPLLVGFTLLLGPAASWGQAAPAAPHGYDFLTVLTIESSGKSNAKLLITPAFQNTSEIPLAAVQPQYASGKNTEAVMQNTLLINQKLSDLTAAGWELLQVYTVPPASGTGINPAATRYLFRKAKN